MSLGMVRSARAWSTLLVAALVAIGCSGTGLFKTHYEYEEDLYPALDGSATLYLKASLASLVALRGLDLNADPKARVDRPRIRRMFQAPGVTVGTPTLSRRSGRRFVHVRIEAERLETLATVEPLAWSFYQFRREADMYLFRHRIGGAVNRAVDGVEWLGSEQVAFRLHPPSRITFHNSPGAVRRGNILLWEQPLAARLRGAPLDLQVRMEAKSILAHTLVLFGSTIVAAAVALGLLVWWIARRGKAPV
jgi:hypothetical protein